MNLDELISQITDVSEDPDVTRLAQHLGSWKQGEATAEELRQRTEHFIGNSWIQSDEEHSRVYELWTEFRDQNIKGIGGMTMNERLYLFGLCERFDACETDDSRMVVYKKLHACVWRIIS